MAWFNVFPQSLRIINHAYTGRFIVGSIISQIHEGTLRIEGRFYAQVVTSTFGRSRVELLLSFSWAFILDIIPFQPIGLLDKIHLLTIHVRPEPRVLRGALAASSVTYRSVAESD